MQSGVDQRRPRERPEIIQVLNKSEVHPKLAEEIVRDIQGSPRWIPAQFYGQEINGSIPQPIVFAVTR